MSEKLYTVEVTAIQLSLLISTLDTYLAAATKYKGDIDTTEEEVLYNKLKKMRD